MRSFAIAWPGLLELLPLIGQPVKLFLTMKTMSKKERKPYDKAFKLMAVELHRSGKPAGNVHFIVAIPIQE
jgi:hypothetical protein